MKRLIALLLCALFAACSGNDKPQANSSTGPEKPVVASPGLAALLLAADPGEGLSVVAAKAAAPKDDVIVVGRISDVMKGHAAFQLCDASLTYCGQGGKNMDQCLTPWDYCCIEQSEKVANTLFVEALGPDGKTLKASALPGVRQLDLVAVKGKLIKDADGNVAVQASGWFRRERPTVKKEVKFP